MATLKITKKGQDFHITSNGGGGKLFFNGKELVEKVENATENNFAALDSNGKIKDSGKSFSSLQPSCIRVALNTNKTFNCDASTYFNLQLNNTRLNLGNAFTLDSDGSVVANKDMRAVGVSGSIYCYGGTTVNDKYQLSITKNGTNFHRAIQYVHGIQSIVVPFTIINNIKQGDKFYLRVYGEKDKTLVVAGQTSETCMDIIEIL